MKIWKYYTLITVDLFLFFISILNIVHDYSNWGNTPFDDPFGDKISFGTENEHFLGLFLLILSIVLSIYIFRNPPPKGQNKFEKTSIEPEVDLDKDLPNFNADSSSEETQILSENEEEINLEGEKAQNNKGFRGWLNKKEGALNNFLLIALGTILIPTYFFLSQTFQNYVIGLANGSVAYGEYPFEKNYVYLVSWMGMGIPFLLLLSYLIS